MDQAGLGELSVVRLAAPTSDLIFILLLKVHEADRALDALVWALARDQEGMHGRRAAEDESHMHCFERTKKLKLSVLLHSAVPAMVAVLFMTTTNLGPTMI